MSVCEVDPTDRDYGDSQRGAVKHESTRCEFREAPLCVEFLEASLGVEFIEASLGFEFIEAPLRVKFIEAALISSL